MIWGEMKQNAEAITSAADSEASNCSKPAKNLRTRRQSKVRLHLIGHSAELSCTAMHRTAVRQRLDIRERELHGARGARGHFQNKVVPHQTAKSGASTIHLSDDMEQKDPPAKRYSATALAALLVSHRSKKAKSRRYLHGKYFNEKIAPMNLNSGTWLRLQGIEECHAWGLMRWATMASVIGLVRGKALNRGNRGLSQFFQHGMANNQNNTFH